MASVGESLRSIFEGLTPGPAVMVPGLWSNQQPMAPTAAPAGHVQEDPQPTAPKQAQSVVLEVFGILGHGEFYLPENGIRINLPAETVARIMAGDSVIQLDVPTQRLILPLRCDY
jgi:hypothetical protein